MPEVELKFAVRERDCKRIARSAALAGSRPVRRRLTTLYLDTPGRLLWKRGMALRLRRAGPRWVQSLKGGRSGRGGLHRRDEWEFDRPDASIDLSLFAGTPLARVPDAARLHERLEVAFTVDMVRTAWVVSPRRGVRLEVALDVGEVTSRGRSEPIRELEIECLEGPVGGAFDLASRLLHDAPLRASAISKAERGWRLFGAAALRPAKARRIALDPSMSLSRAAREVAGAALEQLQANEEGVLQGDDPEFVHQARVALRRLRSALRMFRRAVGRKRSRAWRTQLARLSCALGVARDWDVFALATLPPILAAQREAEAVRHLDSTARRRALDERRRAARALLEARYARTLLAISRWLAGEAGAKPAREEPLAAFGARVMAKRHRRVLERARHAARLDAAGRHRLRIEAKRLRYGVDALASLFPSERTQRYRQALCDLQDALGEANDATTAARLVAELPAPARFVRFARLRFDAAARAHPGRIARLLRRLRETGPPGRADARAP